MSPFKHFSAHNWIMIALSMVGKFGISAAFGEIFIYTGELFPTVVRSVVMGICSFGARIGSSISPYMYQIVSSHLSLPVINITFILVVIHEEHKDLREKTNFR